MVARWTGIPVDRLSLGDSARLLELKDRLAARVVGQKRAVTVVSDAILRSRAFAGTGDVLGGDGKKVEAPCMRVSFPFSILILLPASTHA